MAQADNAKVGLPDEGTTLTSPSAVQRVFGSFCAAFSTFTRRDTARAIRGGVQLGREPCATFGVGTLYFRRQYQCGREWW